MQLIYIRHLPMLTPPRRWTDPFAGGYHTAPVMLMRVKEHEQLDALRRFDLTAVYQALDVLGGTPWQINHRVLQVVEEAWESGGGISEVPSRTDRPLPVPPPLTGSVEDRELLLSWRQQVKRTQRLNLDLHCLRCDFLLKLSVARTFGREPRFFFPHNVDFRGRAYPIPPHLNHMGSDICRGLLLFAEGRPLGPRGLFWLKVRRISVSY